MIQIAQGDEAALGELYDRYGRLIFSVALNVVGDRASAEEITLDVFTRAWQKAGTYDSRKAKVVTWLTRMARNRAIDVLRREDVRPSKYSISWAETTVDPIGDDNPETAAHLSLEAERIRVAVATLPETQQEVLALAYFKGYSHSEIATALDLPLGTVKGRLRSSMITLRLILVDE